ncbi:serine hydrolase [Flavivirga aquimarina]|uniref:Serine hydrolase n=1 Tax=Flavivirga aquimarina TaxID=2027862 RepID=A0ABT8WBR6_9FLAO|nr:serine hydrolase [Flavivirga aquimarina]MDO5970585.1 serine hydrolase [Flavivirga aquimarina]
MKLLSKIRAMCFLSLFILLATCKIVAQTNNNVKESNPEIELLEEKLEEIKKAFNVPGLAVGIIKEGEIVYAKGLGVQDLETNIPLSTQSVYHMASVSKPFVATAIMQLCEQNKIELDKKLIKYLPYFTMKDERYKNITILHILTHSSGIPDVINYEWNNPKYDDIAAEEHVRSFKSKELDFTPGEKYNYSNAAFDILADVIAKASGMTFESYMKEFIFKPVGMKNTTFYKPEVPKKIATKPHTLDNELKMAVEPVYPYNRIHAPSSTLHSNIDDMLLWAKINLNKGKVGRHKIYNEISYTLLTTGQRKISKNDSLALSWFISPIRDYKMIRHSGRDTGYNTYFGFIPKTKSAIVLMANNDIFFNSDVANYLLKYILFGESNRVKTPIHYLLKDYILSNDIEKCKEIYFDKKRYASNKYNFEIWTLDQFGYWLINKNHYKKALEVFQFNLVLFPKHPGLIDSVTDAYKAMDNKKMAIVWYKKALKIKPDQEISKKKLDALMNE